MVRKYQAGGYDTGKPLIRVVDAIGSILAAVLSASLNHSFWWGVLHFWCSWVYVLYALLCRSKEILPALRAMFGA